MEQPAYAAGGLADRVPGTVVSDHQFAVGAGLGPRSIMVRRCVTCAGAVVPRERRALGGAS
jgi:hypothetical protein